jgi:hypothetical protein
MFYSNKSYDTNTVFISRLEIVNVAVINSIRKVNLQGEYILTYNRNT